MVLYIVTSLQGQHWDSLGQAHVIECHDLKAVLNSDVVLYNSLCMYVAGTIGTVILKEVS